MRHGKKNRSSTRRRKGDESMGTIKQGFIIFIVLWIVYMLGYSDQNDEVSAQFADRTFQFLDWTLLTYQTLLVIVVTLIVVGIIMGVYWLISTRRESAMRLKNGSFPLIVHKTKQGIHVVDVNQMIGPSMTFDKMTGQLTTSVNASTQNYIEANQQVQRTRMLASMENSGGFKYTAVGKFLAGQWGPRQSTALPVQNFPEESPVEVQPMTLPDAWRQTTRSNWILGYHSETSEPFNFSLIDGHVGLLGGTGTGKTTFMAYLLIAYALRYRYQVAVFDGKNITDYGSLKPYIQYQGVDYESFPTYLEGIWETYTERSQALKESGFNTIEELGNYPPLLIILEELGAVMDGLKLVNQRAYKRASIYLGQLLRLSRVAGIQLVIIDQDPTKIPSTVLANLPMNLCFAMGGSKGNALGEYNLQTLKKPGQFQVRGERYWTWPVYAELNKILNGLDKRQVLPQVESSQSIRVIEPTRLMIESSTQESRMISEPDEDVTPMDNAIPLIGPPWSPDEEKRIYSIYLQEGSITAACKALWKNRSPTKRQWVRDVVAKFDNNNVVT